MSSAGIDITPQKNGDSWPIIEIGGLVVEIREDGYQITSAGSSIKGAKLPSQISPDWVSEISIYEWIPIRPYRNRGVYKLRSAEIYVDSAAGEGRNSSLHLVIKCKYLADGKELYEAIRAGIATPVVSWEKEQIKASIRTVAELFKEIWQILRFKINQEFAKID